MKGASSSLHAAFFYCEEQVRSYDYHNYEIYANKLVEHPAAQALSSVISDNRMTRGWLKWSLEAHFNDARKEVTDIPETLREYTINILYMTLQAGGISRLLLLLGSFPYHAGRNRHFLYIPTDVAAKHGLLATEGGQSEVHLDLREGLCDAVFEMASIANVRLVLLPAVPVQVFLDSLSREFEPRLERVPAIPPLWYQLKLKWSDGGENTDKLIIP
ncbi:hypothetical protein P3X46_016570 [Hevea brasiliensis]|uniref:Aminotransferase-like plant mobile domain-containing protein n=1 Tax=Hevea brasiliensis TaxID=3981 RepID=A0ABQ9M1W6_HEVBR|nr:hypothetical protein P3X46_016570 [Hevea brasiliensis]